ncbi:MAG TPA: undecaprenyl-diphosphate phosphatase [Candidatus Nanoarchaeia archaeon]|nr:undecaprenyl-diphosphate phosphatase [Candidatus Nanoarchaeia archaeon]
MEIYQSIILGILQGLTEWLPVSSSGHLAIAQNLFNLENPIFFDIILHVATLIVLFIVFRNEISMIFKAIFTWDKDSKYFRWGWYLVIANIGTAIIGLTFRNFFASLFSSLIAVGIALMINGIILELSSLKEGFKRIEAKSAFAMGLAQGIAIIPGISRSGATITTGMLMKAEKEDAAKFSFLMSIPAIIGAAILEGASFSWKSFELLPFALGFVFSGIVGYVTLNWLMKIIARGKFYKFSYYSFGIGLLALIIAILGKA